MKTTVSNYSASTNTTEVFAPREDLAGALVTASILILLGLLGNGFIWVSFFVYRRIRTLTNYFIVNLATADLLQVLTLVCWIVFAVIRPKLPLIVANHMLVSIDILCSSASMLSLAAVSLDRHYAITYSLQYRSIVTAKRTVGCVVAIWLYSAFVCGLSWSRGLVKSKFELYNKAYITSLVAFSFVLPMATILYCYFKVRYLRLVCDFSSKLHLDMSSIFLLFLALKIETDVIEFAKTYDFTISKQNRVSLAAFIRMAKLFCPKLQDSIIGASFCILTYLYFLGI